MDNKIKQEINKIDIPEELHERVLLGVALADKKEKREWSLPKKIKVFSSVAVILAVLLVSSAFVSPSMARVVSSIPYLGAIFQSEPIGSIIAEKLTEEGYEVSSTGVTANPKKKVEIVLAGSAEDVAEVKETIGDLAEEILASKGYDAYTVEVSPEQQNSEYQLTDNKQTEKNVLDQEVTEKLEAAGYQFDQVQTDPTEKSIFINITGSEEYFESVKEAVEKAAVEAAASNNYAGYTGIATRVSSQMKPVEKGAMILPAMAEGFLSREKFDVTGVAYRNNPLTFIIRTSLSSSGPEAERLGSEIETMIIEYLESERIVSILDGEAYHIVVESEDGQKIN